ncbi:hypothetical protein ACWGQ5_29975 [Streptomyces sp. NPDC055722]
MASTFEELVEMQRAAADAQSKADELREKYGPPTATAWTRQQTELYETALRAWRDLDRDLQVEITEYAKEHSTSRSELEDEVRTRAEEPAGDA